MSTEEDDHVLEDGHADPPLTPAAIEDLKRQRKVARRKVTVACNNIRNGIQNSSANAGALRAILHLARDALSLAEQLEEQLAHEPDADHQYEIHVGYVSQLGQVVGEIEAYLGEAVDADDNRSNTSGRRQGADQPPPTETPQQTPGDPDSDAEEMHQDTPDGSTTHPPNGETTRRPPAIEQPRARYMQRANRTSVQRQVTFLDDDGATARWCEDARAMHSAPFHYSVDDSRRHTYDFGDSSVFPQSFRRPSLQDHVSATQMNAAARWRNDQSGHSPHYNPRRVENPDDWIDQYRAGQLAPVSWQEFGARSSVRADLEPYSGKSLEWFSWIDLFRALVHDTGKAPGEKLAILKRNLRGDCLNVVYSLGGGEDAYMEALFRLKQTYGRRDVMRAAHLQAIDRLEIGRQDSISFTRFADKINTHLFDLNRIGGASSLETIERICKKLHQSDRQAWNERRVGRGCPTMNEFGSWLCQRASTYQNAYTLAAEQLEPPQQQRHRDRNNDRYRARAHQSSTTPRTDGGSRPPAHEGENRPPAPDGGRRAPGQPYRPFCFKCEKEHRLDDCADFRNLTATDRLNFCVRHRLCFSCLRARHSTRDCGQAKQCRFPNCTMRHHPLLHDAQPSTIPPATPAPPPPTSAPPAGGRRSNSARGRECKVALGVVQLDAISEDGVVITVNVLLDEGSDTTLIREDVSKRLKLNGPPRTLDVDVVGGLSSSALSRRVRVQLRPSTGEHLLVEASTMPIVTKPVPVVDWHQLRSRWRHLADLPLKRSGGQIDILLGLDYAHLMAVLEARNGEDDQPIATRTRLGWVVRGVIECDPGPLAARVHAVFGAAEEEVLADAVRRFCDTENFGTEHSTAALSVDDRQAVDILQHGMVKLEVGYEVPITWRTGEPNLPNNRLLAEKRLQSLLRRFQLEPAFEKEYRAAMQKNFDKGYAIVLGDQPASDGEYYTAHHGVYKGPKLRVVFDAAAKFRGKCLNDAMLRGPALQTPLAAVLIRFREGAVAWAADVEAMFSRVRLRQSDKPYFRFLWQREGEQNISVCEMQRLPFGATCSPFIAISVTRRAATDYAGSPVAQEAINKKMYVDDYLSSAKSAELGVMEARATKQALADGDMHLQSWISNSSEFLLALGESATADESNLTGEDTEKVLGIHWRPSHDTLGYKVGDPDVTFTYVGLLSQVASLFDPLGTAAPLTIKAKIRLRLLGLKGLKWNDLVDGEDRRWWEQ